MKDHLVEKNKDNTTEKPLTPMPQPPLTLERKLSIDTEPKTLLQEELDLAREAALKIINTHPKEEALKIFLKGLVPVTSSKMTKEDAANAAMSDCDDDE